jgi:chromosome partitioning protein
LLELASQKKLHKVVVLNPKGGSGKTTLAFSLAGYLASTGRKVGLLDMDRQGSSTHWLRNRPDALPVIRALPAPADGSGAVDVPDDVDCVVIDAPAGLAGDQLIDYTCGAHAILVPVLPSDLDIHAASRLISQLLLKAQVSRRNGRLGIVANRVKERTVAYKQLLRFLDRLSINLVGVLRDSQNYTHAAANGRCIHEMAPSQVRRDTEQWQAITEWLEARLELAIVMWFLAATREAPVEPSPEPVSPQVAFSSTPVEPIERGVAEPLRQPVAEEPVQPSASEALQERWQLTGVVSANGTDVLMLSDREEQRTVRLSGDSDLDGWAVKESGSNYAVLVQGEDEVRLVLNEDTAL